MLAKETARPELMRSWGRYRTTRRFVTVKHILMNATSNETLDENDLSTFNIIVGKMSLPPAVAINPERFASLPSGNEAIVENAAGGAQITCVADVIRFGVKWRGEVLLKAVIKGCSADYVTIAEASAGSSLATDLKKDLEDRLTESIRLSPSDIEEFLDLHGRRDDADQLFEVLEKSHPDEDFFLEPLNPGDRYIQRRMRVNGTAQPGQNCEVSEVTHKALLRRSDPNWRVPAFVKIRNIDPNEPR